MGGNVLKRASDRLEITHPCDVRLPVLTITKRQLTGGRAGDDAVGPGGSGCFFCSRMRCLAAA
jgi:hypothetical protein